jgi:hypothetical protein
MTTTQHEAQPAVPTMLPLWSQPDQYERWITHAERPIPFEEAAQLVLNAHSADGERDDVLVDDIRTWTFVGKNGVMAIAPVPLAAGEPMEALPLRHLAFTQLCRRVGAARSYVRRLPAELQIADMNRCIQRAKHSAMLRLAGGEVRAVVSRRYTPLDDKLVLEVVADVLDEAGLMDVAFVRATAVGTSTVLRVTTPDQGVAVKPNDVIEYGFDVSNSELGLRSLSIRGVFYRLVCTNGLRVRQEGTITMRHIGDPKRLHELLRHAMREVLAEAPDHINRWRRATEVRIGSALEEIAGLRKLGLSQGEAQAVGRELLAAMGLLPASSSAETITEALRVSTTAYDVANAITASARARANVAARLRLEEAGYRYLMQRAA